MSFNTDVLLKKYDEVMGRAVDNEEVGTIEAIILRSWLLWGIDNYKQTSEVKTQ